MVVRETHERIENAVIADDADAVGIKTDQGGVFDHVHAPRLDDLLVADAGVDAESVEHEAQVAPVEEIRRVRDVVEMRVLGVDLVRRAEERGVRAVAVYDRSVQIRDLLVAEGFQSEGNEGRGADTVGVDAWRSGDIRKLLEVLSRRTPRAVQRARFENREVLGDALVAPGEGDGRTDLDAFGGGRFVDEHGVPLGAVEERQVDPVVADLQLEPGADTRWLQGDALADVFVGIERPHEAAAEGNADRRFGDVRLRFDRARLVEMRVCLLRDDGVIQVRGQDLPQVAPADDAVVVEIAVVLVRKEPCGELLLVVRTRLFNDDGDEVRLVLGTLDHAHAPCP